MNSMRGSGLQGPIKEITTEWRKDFAERKAAGIFTFDFSEILCNGLGCNYHRGRFSES